MAIRYEELVRSKLKSAEAHFYMQEYERLKTSHEAFADELYAAINAG